MYFHYLKICHARIDITASNLMVVRDLTTHSSLPSLRPRLGDPNIAIRCNLL